MSIKLTDEQKQEILTELEKVCDSYEKDTETYKINSTYLADTKYTKAYLKAKEDNIRYAKNCIAKLKNGEELADSMWIWLSCIIAICKPNESEL